MSRTEEFVTDDNVAGYYDGACLGKMLMGNWLIEEIFCTGEIFIAILLIQVSMTKNALENLTGCLHYSKDWELMLMGNVVWGNT